jgi:hypothetical protein
MKLRIGTLVPMQILAKVYIPVQFPEAHSSSILKQHLQTVSAAGSGAAGITNQRANWRAELASFVKV